MTVSPREAYYATKETKQRHENHRIRKVSEVSGDRTFECVDCREIFVVRIDGYKGAKA